MDQIQTTESLIHYIPLIYFSVPMCSPPDLLLWNQSVPEKNSPVSSKLQKNISNKNQIHMYLY